MKRKPIVAENKTSSVFSSQRINHRRNRPFTIAVYSQAIGAKRINQVNYHRPLVRRTPAGVLLE